MYLYRSHSKINAMGLDIMTKWDSIYKGTLEVIYCLVRQFIGIGKDPQTFGIASARISKAFSLLCASTLIVIIQTLSCWFFGLLRGSSFRCGNFARDCQSTIPAPAWLRLTLTSMLRYEINNKLLF